MRLLSLLLTICIFTGCRLDHKTFEETTTTDTTGKETKPYAVEDLAWLEGKWISNDGQGQFIEEWRKSAGQLTGQGRMISGSDTNILEQLNIIEDSGVKYVVNFPNREVRFYLKTTTHTESRQGFSHDESVAFTFVNDTNDFPSQIVYHKQNDDSLYITLTGKEDGRTMEMTFRMKKQ